MPWMWKDKPWRAAYLPVWQGHHGRKKGEMTHEEAKQFLAAREKPAKDWRILAEKLASALSDYDESPSADKWIEIQRLSREIRK